MLNIISDLHSFYYAAPLELKLNCNLPAINISRRWRYVKQMKFYKRGPKLRPFAPFGGQGY